MKKNKEAYLELRKKIVRELLLRLLLALALTYTLYEFIWVGRGGNIITTIIQRVFFTSRLDALDFYHFYIRKNAPFIVMFVAGLSFIQLIWFFIRSVTSYFKLIDSAVDALLVDKMPIPPFPNELFPMYKKLSSVKAQLLEDKLAVERANKKKEELILNLTHDIRTPLTAQIGYLKLAEDFPEMAETVDSHAIVLKNALKIESMLDDLFTLTKEGANGSLSLVHVRVYETLSQLTQDFMPMAQKRGISVQLDIPEDFTIFCDRNNLLRACTNLIKNAISYADESSTILIVAKNKGATSELSVTSQGLPISKKEQERIFEKFIRLDQARNSDTGGTGLGLYITKKIMEAHGGSIHINTTADSNTFILSFPNTNA